MKCPTCQKGTMEKKKDTIKQDGVEFEALKCSQCGEEIMTMKQLKALAGRYRKLRNAKEIIFAKWGNNAGKHGILIKEKEGIKLTPVA